MPEKRWLGSALPGIISGRALKRGDRAETSEACAAGPPVHLRPLFACEADFPGRLYQRLDLLQAQLLGILHFDNHTPACQPPLQAHPVLETGLPSGPSCAG